MNFQLHFPTQKTHRPVKRRPNFYARVLPGCDTSFLVWLQGLEIDLEVKKYVPKVLDLRKVG